jgi:GGDEF domain-containing protein
MLTVMDQENEGIWAAFKREPDQAWLLLKVVLVGAIAIVAWDLASSYFLSDIASAVVSLLLVLAYALCLAYLTNRLVKSMDRFQVESAKQATRLATTRRRVERPTGEFVLPPTPPASFQQDYFLLRLNEEVKQARLHGRLLSLIAIDVTVPNQEMTPELVERVSFEVAEIASDHARTISLPLAISETEFLFCLPQIDGKGVKTFTSHLVTALGRYWCHFGIAAYPEDGTDAETLFNRAREACELSRQDIARPPRSEAIA